MVILYSFISFFFSLLTYKYSLPRISKRLIDKPNHRSSHKLPTKTGGGLIFVILGTIFSILLKSYLPLICFPLALIGLADDILNISSISRYLIQLFIVNIIIYFSSIYYLDNIYILLNLLVFLVLVFVGTAIINFINFMDGIDGLVGSCLFICFSVSALSFSPWLWPLITSLLAFLFWNWSPAKIFMGNVGSTFLGAMWFGLILQSNSFNNAVGLLLVSTPLIFDAATCVIRRYLAGHNIFVAHRLHLYQRLERSGWSHSTVTLIYFICSIFLGVSFLLSGLFGTAISSFIVISLGVYLDKNKAVPFLIRIEE